MVRAGCPPCGGGELGGQGSGDAAGGGGVGAARDARRQERAALTGMIHWPTSVVGVVRAWVCKRWLAFRLA